MNIVDPASSHMLVSKIKPCMSQYKLLCGDESQKDQAEPGLVLYLAKTTLPQSRVWAHVLALELPQLSL